MTAREMIAELSKLDPETVVTMTEWDDHLKKNFEWSMEISGSEINRYDIVKSWTKDDE